MLRRLISALEREPGAVCPVCDGERLVWKYELDHEPSTGPVCADCRNPGAAARAHPGGLADARRGRLLMSA